MNYSTAILLINPACRAIKAIYEPDPTDENRPRAKRTLFKTFDPSIKAGDIAMVPSTTRHMVTTVIDHADHPFDFFAGVNVPFDINIGHLDNTAEVHAHFGVRILRIPTTAGEGWP